MMVWLSMSCMKVSARTTSGRTSCRVTSAHGMASRSSAPERDTQASRSNMAITVGQKYYPRGVQTSRKAYGAEDRHLGSGRRPAGGMTATRESVSTNAGRARRSGAAVGAAAARTVSATGARNHDARHDQERHDHARQHQRRGDWQAEDATLLARDEVASGRRGSIARGVAGTNFPGIGLGAMLDRLALALRGWGNDLRDGRPERQRQSRERGCEP